MPSGKLICAKNGNSYKWYKRAGETLSYIPKRNREEAESLAYKKYLTSMLDDLNAEKKALECYLKYHRGECQTVLELLSPDSGYRELLLPHFSVSKKDQQQWMNETFRKNENYPEQLIIRTSSGNFVRSKSEALIDTILTINKIPFRYECALEVGDSVFYPDFTIMHPQTSEILYWEHFGMMDNEIYMSKAFMKLKQYVLSNIIPGINLITTYETKEHPLDMLKLEKIVNMYFE